MKKYIVGILALSAILTYAPALQAEGETISEGKTVKFNYTLTVDGQVVDTSEGKEPLEYTQGKQMIIPGLESQLEGLKVGDHKVVTVAPKDGYGETDEKAVLEVPRNMLPADAVPQAGMMVQFPSEDGRIVRGIIKEVLDEKLVVDFNHPLAGKELTFDITIAEIK